MASQKCATEAPSDSGEALSYLRWSSKAQRLGDSGRRQLDRTRAYCLANNLTLREELVDDGLSAYKGHHRRKGSLGSLLERVEAGAIPVGTTLIVEALDRLSRQQPRLAQEQFLALINRGLRIVTLLDGQAFDAASVDRNPGQLFMSIGMMMGYHAESRNKAGRVKEAWSARRSRVHRTCPRWIEVRDGRYELIPERQAVIERIFTMCVDGIGPERIARILNREGVAPFANTPWHDVYIRALLSERAVRGEVERHEYVEDKRVPLGVVDRPYPAAVSEDLWQRVRDAMRRRRPDIGRKGPERANLFGPLARCAVCGGRMRIRAKGRGPRKLYVYLQCVQARAGTCTHTRYCNYNLAEVVVLDHMHDIALASNPDEREAALRDRIAALLAERQAAEKRQTRLVQALGQLENPAPVLAMLNELTGELRRLDAALDELRSQQRAAPPDTVRATLQTLRREMHAVQGAERFAVRSRIAEELRKVIDALLIYPDGDLLLSVHRGGVLSLLRDGAWINGMIGTHLVDPLIREVDQNDLTPPADPKSAFGTLEDIRYRGELLRRVSAPRSAPAGQKRKGWIAALLANRAVED